MTSNQTFDFAQRYRKLASARRLLEFEMSKLAREIRVGYPAGSVGDERFHKWCETELGITRGESLDFLDRSVAFAAVPDKATWVTAGGFKEIRSLRNVSKSEQVTMIEVVKATGRKISSQMRERSRTLAALQPDISPKIAQRKTPEQIDVAILAEFILANVPKMPASIRKIAERYAAAKLRAVA